MTEIIIVAAIGGFVGFVLGFTTCALMSTGQRVDEVMNKPKGGE